jgi:hypothetical protein
MKEGRSKEGDGLWHHLRGAPDWRAFRGSSLVPRCDTPANIFEPSGLQCSDHQTTRSVLPKTIATHPLNADNRAQFAFAQWHDFDNRALFAIGERDDFFADGGADVF